MTARRGTARHKTSDREKDTKKKGKNGRKRRQHKETECLQREVQRGI